LAYQKTLKRCRQRAFLPKPSVVVSCSYLDNSLGFSPTQSRHDVLGIQLFDPQFIVDRIIPYLPNVIREMSFRAANPERTLKQNSPAGLNRYPCHDGPSDFNDDVALNILWIAYAEVVGS